MNTEHMRASEIIELENRHATGLYAKQPIVFVRGQGALLWDSEGREYLDCAAGHGVASLGHAHPQVAAAVAEQAGTLITLFETFYNERRALLAAKLCGLVPGLERVFFCNTGTEAVEAALKFARLSTGRSEVVAAMRAFHGRTFGSLSATYNKKYREPYEPLVPGFSHVAYNDLVALERAVTDQTAAVILEAVQGEGGVYPATPEYLQAARRICSERGALLILDEVQSGFGRTGKWFAFQHSGITPDLLCVAKALAGGLPMGAVLIGPAVQNFAPGLHGSTFGGNPLVCAAALASLGVMESEDLPAQAARKGAWLVEQIRALRSPVVREVRGLGLMVGIELRQKAAPYLKALQERQVLALNAGMTVIRLLPPLVITDEQLERLAVALGAVLAGPPPAGDGE